MSINWNRINRPRLAAGMIFALIAIFLLVKIAGGNTPEAKIRRTFRDLCEAASKTESDGSTALLLSARTIQEVFAPETTLELKPSFFSGKYTPEEIAANMVRFRGMFATVKVSARDLEITVDSTDAAQAECTGMLNGTTKSGEQVNEVRDLNCALKLIDGKWRIAGITVREILEK